MRTVFIVNPVAGGGRASRVWKHLRDEALGGCAPAEERVSTAPGEATTLARDALADPQVERVVAVGGDGTTNEVLNGILGSREPGARDVALGLLSVGTGRDLARTLAIPRDPVAQLERLRQGRTRRIDVGRVHFVEPPGTRSRYFCNVASFGLSGVTDAIMSRSRNRVLPAKLAFQVAVVRALVSYRNARVRVRVDGHGGRQHTVKIAAACNGSHFGGGMRIAPYAEPDDALLDWVVVDDVSVWKLLRKLRTVYRGEHLDIEEVSWARVRRVAADPLDPEVPVLLDIDGEAVGRLPATFEVIPAALTVCC